MYVALDTAAACLAGADADPAALCGAGAGGQIARSPGDGYVHRRPAASNHQWVRDRFDPKTACRPDDGPGSLWRDDRKR